MAEDALSLLFRIRATGGKEAAAEVGKLRSAVKTEISGITSEFAGATGAAGRLASALGPVGVGLTIAGGAAIVAGTGIFKLAQHAADAGARFHDMSIETGLTVETLSGLELQLIQSGSSLDSFNNGVFLLQKNLAQASEGNKELKSTFAQLGIKDTSVALADTDATLKTLLKSLAAITDEGTRNAVGAKVMGRAYKDLRVFLQDTGGDLDKVIEKARAAGLVMSKEAAAAADEFGDNLDALKYQLSAVARNIGGDFVPVITRGMASISAALSSNAADWGRWAGLVRAAREIALTGVSLSLPIPFGKLGRKGVGDVMRRPANVFTEGIGTDESAGGAFSFKPSGGGGGGKGGGGGGDTAAERALRALKLAEQEEEAFHRSVTEQIQREFEQREISLEESTRREIAELEGWLANKKVLFDEEEAIIRRSTKNAEERAEKLRELQVRRTEAEAEVESRRAKLEQDAADEAARIAVARAEGLARILDAEGERRIARIREQGELRVLTTEEVERRIGELELAAHDRQSALVSAALQEARIDSEERQRLANEEAERQSQRAALVEDVERRIRAAREETARQEADIAQGKFERRADFDKSVGTPATMGETFGNLGTSISESLGLTGENAEAMGASMANAFGAATGAFEGMIHSILMGEKLSGAAFAKMAKSAIASVAAEAAVRALFETAMGIASLFFNPGAAAGHFLAAKTFGLVAAMGAGIALAIPGGGGGGQSAGAAFAGGGSKSSRPNTDTRIIEASRNRPSEQVVRVVLESDDLHIARVIETNVSNNGSLRGLIVQTADS